DYPSAEISMVKRDEPSGCQLDSQRFPQRDIVNSDVFLKPENGDNLGYLTLRRYCFMTNLQRRTVRV
ncbi:MAG: hypothetical protein Q8O48_09785, partial [Anaerolineales bacterium]|nr:hypothetical protein [Anaerolineales bacterium]